ncbi:MAG: DNA replication and repair protein RecF [Polyangiaceae bacterium]
MADREPPRLVLSALAVRDFRNLARVDLAPSPRFNIVSGHNGQGKTSLLEAIYFVATSRSFRTHRPAELVRHGASAASVRAQFLEIEGDGDSSLAPLAREQIAAIDGSRCSVKVDGARPPSLGAFATRSPVVAFHPDEMALSTGPASLRRTLLDRLALFMSAVAADHRARYERALKARQELLRRPDRGSEGEVDAFEALAAKHGAALTRAREQASEALLGDLSAAFHRIAAPDLVLHARYAPGGSAHEEEAAEALRKARRGDALRPTSSFGPHRDDLVLTLDGKSARVVASQGQHRAITLALKAAEVTTIGRVRGVAPILLLDDVSSELDADRTDALFAYLDEQRGQIFVTTTRRPLIALPSGLAAGERHFSVAAGAVADAA